MGVNYRPSTFPGEVIAMSSRSSSRRRISRVVATVLVLVLAGGLAFGGAPAAKPPKVTAVKAGPGKAVLAVVHTRKEIHNLSSTEITNYRKGVALMQSRAFADPTSWIYQAN